MNEVETIIQTLKDTFDGEAWHGPNVKSVLSKITGDKAENRIGNGHSIIELVRHMTSWRLFVLRKLQGDNEFDVSDELNFPKEGNWEGAIAGLEQSQRDLLRELSRFDAKKLKEIVPGRKYSFSKLLHGIIHHDLYHLGQIVMIFKQF